jgi:hypothetical protein
MKKRKPLDDTEWACLWMAINFAINRNTKACTLLPYKIVEKYYWRIDQRQRDIIVNILEEHEISISKITGEEGKAFGEARNTWLKFWAAMDNRKHYKQKMSDGKEYDVFNYDGKIFPLEEYVKNPQFDTFAKDEHIQD